MFECFILKYKLKNIYFEMNESNQLIQNKIKNIRKKIVYLKVKVKKNYLKENNSKYQCIAIVTLVGLIVGIILLLGLLIFKINNNDDIVNINEQQNHNETHQNISNNPQNLNNSKPVHLDTNIKFDLEKYKNDIKENKQEDSPRCDELDPINILSRRLESNPTTICENGKSMHICYKNDDSIFVVQNGVICKMENIILDPSKWQDRGFIYKGPVDPSSRGCPLLNKGFFNIKCENKAIKYSGYGYIYNSYFDGWNYDYKEKEDEKELAPGKTIFFLSRNQDSPNLYHGGSEFVNALSMMYLLNLNPEDIQVVFLDSIALNDDPFYDLYKNLVSRGGEPIYIKNLTKKYHISSAYHVPINWDSPCFIHSEIPSCKYPTKTYKFYNDLIDKYMSIPNYVDSFKSDDDIFYYPKSVIESHNSNINFTKIVTFQWRRVWPKGRTGQQRILGNGPELAERLAQHLPKNILVRLIDTARLPISEQIAILRKTDYYVGMHGAGLCLSIYSPNHCIFHEVLPRSNMNGLLLMAALSGHITYSDVINSYQRQVKGNELFDFKEDEFVNTVIAHMKENKFID